MKRILQVVENGLTHGCSSGYAEEAHALGKLTMTPQSQTLRSISFASTDLKKDRGVRVEPGPLTGIAVLGGSLTGGGVAYMTACKDGLSVHIKDIQSRGINCALKYSWGLLSRQVRQHRLHPNERDRQMALVPGAADYQGLAHRDVVIKAVSEDLALKQRVVSEVEQHCGPRTTFASSTPLLLIGDITAHASRPEQVIGLHFSSPVEKTPLVEVISHRRTGPQAITTMVQLARRQGKTLIVVADKAGSYANRILVSYINEAIRLLVEGEPAEEIGKTLVRFGFPVGPIQLLDEVGIDTSTKIIPVLESVFGERFSPPANIIDVILKDDHRGRKNSRGFYFYETKGRKSRKRPDLAVYSSLDIDRPQSRLPAQQMTECCAMMIFNEAAHYFDEQITRSARDGDTGAVFGIDFPPSLGGPFRYMDTIGTGEIAAILQRLATQYGPRFTSCDTLLRMAEQGTTFWPADRRLT